MLLYSDVIPLELQNAPPAVRALWDGIPADHKKPVTQDAEVEELARAYCRTRGDRHRPLPLRHFFL